jgi:hypothetical protein
MHATVVMGKTKTATADPKLTQPPFQATVPALHIVCHNSISVLRSTLITESKAHTGAEQFA